MEVIAIVVSVALAAGGYVFTYFHGRGTRRVQARLERVNAQLKNLYGPLFVLTKANDAVWRKFKEECWPSHGADGYFGEDMEVTEREKETWRIWMTAVFKPLNERIEQAILDNGDLLEDGELEGKLQDLLSHIASYRATFERWERGDFSHHTALLHYPSGLLSMVEKTYDDLRAEQQRLLGLEAPKG